VEPQFDSMNETDVREIVVRPILHQLGYKHGSIANIRTEVPLRYSNAFLGRKNESKDPPLSGRADYVCEATSYGRWVVEVKSPRVDLSQNDVEQAHTYSAHPEISATHFLLTNGRKFKLFAVGQLNDPILCWDFDKTSENMMTLFNVIGYEAVKRRANVLRPDINKPLGPNLNSTLKLVGGEVIYGGHVSDHPLFQKDLMKGLVGSVRSGHVEREPEGRIKAKIDILSPFQGISELNKIAGINDFEFFASDEFISNNIDSPTILQQVLNFKLPSGIKFSLVPGMQENVMPFAINGSVFTEATGFVEASTFKGILTFEYIYILSDLISTGIPQVDALLSAVPREAKIYGHGEFKIAFQ
jgi:hypothetical protein